MTGTPERGRAHDPEPHTAASVAALIRADLEPDEPVEDVLARLKQLDGTLITVRLTDRLPGGRVEWRLARQLGWIELRNAAYRSGDAEGVCLILARQEGAVPLSSAFVERENPQYFAGRRARNAQRQRALADPALLAQIADVLNDVQRCTRSLAQAARGFAELVAPGSPAEPSRYVLERACGLRADSR